MRLFLVPITPTRTLIYAQRINRQLTSKPTLLEKVTTRAGNTWLKWEAAEKGWQRKVTDYGNKAFAKIPYQEWGLKSIPPLSTRREKRELEGRERISVRFPGQVIKEGEVEGLLKRLATERQALHRQSLLWSIVGMPLTIPFGLIPVIPNLPFFYLAFRAWSHWRALKGSQHIQYLLDKKLINATPSEIMQKVYDLRKVPEETMQALKNVENKDIGDPARDTEVLAILDKANPITEIGNAAPLVQTEAETALLPHGAGKFVSRAMGLPSLDVEIERAVTQVEKIIKKEKELVEEKQELDSAKKDEADKATAEKEKQQ